MFGGTGGKAPLILDNGAMEMSGHAEEDPPGPQGGLHSHQDTELAKRNIAAPLGIEFRTSTKQA